MSELYLINDDKHTFQYVHSTLINYAHQLPIQAEQCCLITHYQGKCMIKSGDFIELTRLKEKLEERKLNLELIP